MPDLPPRACSEPGCPNLAFKGPRCIACVEVAPPPVDYRESASRRGYGRRWEKIRLAFLKKYPKCEECAAEGRVEAATDVDHVIPRGQPGSSDHYSNLRALCHSHHSRKTARRDGGFGRNREESNR